VLESVEGEPKVLAEGLDTPPRLVPIWKAQSIFKRIALNFVLMYGE